jgi:DNA-binding transcriptional MerR regulator
MSQAYTQSGRAFEDEAQAEGAAHDAAEKITGPLTGKDATPETAAKPRVRKSASAFRTISEVADILDVQQHVLRFWETKFSQIRPLKRGGGRRYYRPEDLELLKKIHHLLYTEGYTIKGVQKLLREKGKAAVLQEPRAPQNNNEQKVTTSVQGQVTSASTGMSAKQRSALQAMVAELKELRALLNPE